MGLDMFLFRGKTTELDKYFALPDDERHDTLIPAEEVAYWRKANQIREWFVENCDYPVDGNCEYVMITESDLQDLTETCKKVLLGHHLAEELLPVSHGFFFGSSDYDDWYFEDLKETVKICKKVLEETDWDTESVVYTDWW